MDREDFIKRSIYGSVAKNSRQKMQQTKPFAPASKPGQIKHGKKVVFVTPYLNAAKEEKKKLEEKGFRVEIQKEKDDVGRIVYVVYIFE
jgi:hypothetical protein